MMIWRWVLCLLIVGQGQALAQSAEAKQQFEALLLSVQACSVDADGIKRQCPAFKDYNARWMSFTRGYTERAAMNMTMGRRHLRHPSPAVRILALKLINPAFAPWGTEAELVITAAQTEAHPTVLAKMLDALMTVKAEIPAQRGRLRTLMAKYARHPDIGVRLQVVHALKLRWASGLPGTFDLLKTRVEQDPERAVREKACEAMGHHPGAVAFPFLKGKTAGPSDLYSACVEGVITLWSKGYNTPPYRPAFEYTLELLRRTPRTAAHPPEGISEIAYFSRKHLKSKAWFKRDALIDALSAIITDRQANWSVRRSAVRLLFALDAPVARFEALAHAYAGAEKRDRRVLRKIEETLKRLQPAPPLTDLEPKLLQLSTCAVTFDGIDWECPAYEAFEQAIAKRSDRGSRAAFALAGQYLTHSNEAVRLQIASLLHGALLGGEPRRALIHALQVETSPAVLKHLLAGASMNVHDAGIRSAVITHAQHADARIRTLVIEVLTSAMSIGQPDALPTVMKMVETDADAQVRVKACRALGHHGDAVSLPLLKRLTATPSAEPLYGACFAAVAHMWSGRYIGSAMSKAAWQYTLDALEAPKRSALFPPWEMVSALNGISVGRLEKESDWFDAQALMTALDALLADSKADWRARASAVEVMGKLGVSNTRLQQLRAVHAEGRTPVDDAMRKTIDRVLQSRAR
jgi:HEAT repeat protein